MNNSKNLGINQQERLYCLIKSENYRFWLGGFVEGEGSLTVSISVNSKLTYGLAIQPEFNVVQHESGIEILNSFKILFEGSGSVYKKSGSNKVWVYSLKGRTNLIKFIIPFYTKYVIKYSSKYKFNIFKDFCYILNVLYENKNRTLNKSKFI